MVPKKNKQVMKKLSQVRHKTKFIFGSTRYERMAKLD